MCRYVYMCPFIVHAFFFVFVFFTFLSSSSAHISILFHFVRFFLYTFFFLPSTLLHYTLLIPSLLLLFFLLCLLLLTSMIFCCSHCDCQPLWLTASCECCRCCGSLVKQKRVGQSHRKSFRFFVFTICSLLIGMQSFGLKARQRRLLYVYIPFENIAYWTGLTILSHFSFYVSACMLLYCVCIKLTANCILLRIVV